MKGKYFARSKLTIRGQIRIPKKVQEKLGDVKEGDYILFFDENGWIYIEKGILIPATRK